MSSFFKPARGTRRKVAGASLVLGLSPLLALTPVAAQPAPASPAQNAPAVSYTHLTLPTNREV